MNPNDIMQQQQAILNQAMQGQQHWVWGMIAIQIALMFIIAWVLYMFYARLRDIAEELMKFRVAYEFANPPKSSRPGPAVPTEAAANSFQQGSDARYKPK